MAPPGAPSPPNRRVPVLTGALDEARLLGRLKRGGALFRRDPEAPGRSNRKFSRVLRQAHQISTAPITPTMVTINDDQADIVDDAGFQQNRAEARHRQEEGEIDDDGMLAAIAHEAEPVHFGQQRADSDDGAGAGEAERERDDGPFAGAGIDEAGIRDTPRARAPPTSAPDRRGRGSTARTHNLRTDSRNRNRRNGRRIRRSASSRWRCAPSPARPRRPRSPAAESRRVALMTTKKTGSR